MARVIFKYHLDVGTNKIAMPPGARLLSVQMQGSTITLWAVVHPQNAQPLVKRHIEVVGTGWPVDGDALLNAPFVGTVQTNGMVWHVFDAGEGIP